ncbi:MAG: DUF362 domain-containing protein [Myxococcota bacterium]|nr:DUF362 domain-containing protein [Myxococcota bacterium]
MPRAKPTVIIRDCPEYDTDRIEQIVGEGLDTLGLRPHGRTLVKPNVVASGKHFPHAFTRPEFLEGVLRAIKQRAGEDVEEIAVGERCGITVPTRFAYDGAGYYPMFKRVGVKHYHFEEETQVEIPLYHEQRLRDFFFTPEPIAKADFFVNCPKFKAHPWTTVTFSLKNYIGIQDDPHRLIDHDHSLNEKVADLQYIIQPQFIAIDAITAGEGRMLTPIPYDMGLVIMGNNQVAFDALCCHIIGLDPLSVPHIRMCHERGFGPVHLDQIEVIGDVPLEIAQQRAEKFRVGLIRVEDYFEGTNIQAYSGPPPSDEYDYCWGGCPGALEEAIEILRLFDTETDEKMPKTHIVFGAYEGELDVKDGERVVFLGDCATFQGKINGQDFSLESIYEDRSSKSPYSAKSENIYKKMVGVNWKMFKERKNTAFRIAGCPVSVAEQVLMLVNIGKLKNPYLDPSQVISFNHAYFSSRIRTAFKRMSGNPYQVKGEAKRGEARPVQNLPPQDSAAE